MRAQPTNLAQCNYFHLRRITQNKHNLEAGKQDQNLILLDTMTKFGRNPDMVDIVLTSAVYSNMISRQHSEIVGKRNATGRFEKYTITDHSLNGTYINDKRISGTVDLSEGDVIKFGHMNGAAVKAGQMAPQANAEFAFMIERAIASYSYLGCDSSGRRIHPLACKGNVDSLAELIPTPGGGHEEVRPSAAAGTSTTTTQAATSVAGTAGLTANAALGWPAGAAFGYGTPSSAQFPFSTPAAFQLFGLNNTTPTQANQFMSMLGRQGQLNTEWAAQQMAAMGIPMQRLSTGSAALSFASNPYQAPSTSASFLDSRLAATVTSQPNIALNVQQNAALMSSLLQQQQAHHQQQAQLAQQTQQQQTSVVHPTTPPIVPKQETYAPATPVVPRTADAKPQVSSPPMECDSSVPSPPKTAQSGPAAPKPPTPKQANSEDLHSASEKSWSMVDSPPPPRAPAPSHANRELSRTPSPKSATPEAEKAEAAAREQEERERREKEEVEKKKEEEERDREREKQREKAEKERRERLKSDSTSSSKQHHKKNELAQLLNDLDGSYMTVASRSEARKSIDGGKEKERQKEKEKEREKADRKKEKDKKDKEREQKEKEIERERLEKDKEKKLKEKPKKPVKQHKLLKQLSDVSSGTTDSEEEPSRKKKVILQKKKDAPSTSKKENVKRPPSSSSSGPGSDSDSEDEPPRRGRPPANKKSRQEKTVKPKPAGKKRGRKPKRDSSVSSLDVEAPAPEQDPKVVYHDPVQTCEMGKECNRPQTENVNWVQCDYCDKWYHAICILGKEDVTGLEQFGCGCESEDKKKKKKKAK